MSLKPLSTDQTAEKMQMKKATERVMIITYINIAVNVTIVVVTAIFASMAVAIPIGIVFGLFALSGIVGAIFLTIRYHKLTIQIARIVGIHLFK